MSYSLNGERFPNGENSYSGDHYSNKSQIQRSAKKPAPPVPQNAKPLERTRFTQ